MLNDRNVGFFRRLADLTAGKRNSLVVVDPFPQRNALGFDLVNSMVKCPVEIGIAGLGDYTSPPVGVFCFYNNVKSPKKITFVQNGWHNPKLVKDGIPYTLQSNWK